jgi:ferrous iron transport protein A
VNIFSIYVSKQIDFVCEQLYYNDNHSHLDKQIKSIVHKKEWKIMEMAQAEASKVYQIKAITAPRKITAHLNDLGLRVGVEILMVQKNHKSGIILYGENRIALDASTMTQIEVSEKQQETMLTSLDQLQVGETGKVRKIATTGALRRRLMDMGITKNVSIHVVRLAPLGDPIEIRLRGYDLSLRKQEAAFVFVEKGVE